MGHIHQIHFTPETPFPFPLKTYRYDNTSHDNINKAVFLTKDLPSSYQHP